MAQTENSAWNRATSFRNAEFRAIVQVSESIRILYLNTNLQCSPAMFLPLSRKKDLRDLSNEFLVEDIEKNQPKTRADLIDEDISFMVFAERLNCFYPFQKVCSCPPCPKGVPGLDFCELRGQNGGYILLIPEKKGPMGNAFFRFDSIPASIEFTLPQSFFVQILNIR